MTDRLQVGHHIEDDEVVQEVEEGRDGPFQGAEEGGAGGAAQVSAGATLWRNDRERVSPKIFLKKPHTVNQ